MFHFLHFLYCSLNSVSYLLLISMFFVMFLFLFMMWHKLQECSFLQHSEKCKWFYVFYYTSYHNIAILNMLHADYLISPVTSSYCQTLHTECTRTKLWTHPLVHMSQCVRHSDVAQSGLRVALHLGRHGATSMWTYLTF